MIYKRLKYINSNSCIDIQKNVEIKILDKIFQLEKPIKIRVYTLCALMSDCVHFFIYSLLNAPLIHNLSLKLLLN